MSGDRAVLRPFTWGRVEADDQCFRLRGRAEGDYRLSLRLTYAGDLHVEGRLPADFEVSDLVGPVMRIRAERKQRIPGC